MTGTLKIYQIEKNRSLIKTLLKKLDGQICISFGSRRKPSI
ncbi:hypothetical protein CHCC20331_3407 [Bacillus paralicheniformis]|uniref:Uncharacterized protein n=1 Tax=Bacillus paralicheniformis TaxID=1648923 RepID=A0A7Z0WZU0_9BACI|nr:hypothetical protein B4121_1123 [Bacillus paralicheniformis]TWK46253.1 hypothetical protein CHCC20347_4252 [Bacillus paralicheniformis]TWK80934.1 hypothetical protein CHCC20331_3407 [Bacillus paralicheniformis]